MRTDLFRLNGRTVMLAAVASAYPMVGYGAPAARVDFTVGNVTISSPSGQSRAVTRGAQVEQGETINTNSGRAQLRFTDGAYVSLQPASQFRIDQYKYEGKADGSEKGFFSLLKGGMRTVTGLVGRTNKKNYQVTTSVATIGIRGTEYTIEYGKSVSGAVGEGEIEVCNGAGCLSVTNGESYYVQNQDIKPVLTNKRTDLPPPAPQNPPATFAEGEQVNENGEPCVLDPASCIVVGGAALNGTFTGHMTLAHTQYSGAGSHVGASSAYSGSTTFDSGKLVLMKDNGGGTLGPGTAALVDAGSDEFIGWGRLAGGVLGGSFLGSGDHAGASLSGNESMHYVVGLPTPSLPTLGSVTYSMLGATSPTFTSGSGVVGLGVLESMTLMANLSTGSSGNFSMLLKDPSSNAISLSGSFGGGTFFSGSGSGSGACSGTCFVSVNGFFAGANAERAGVSYDVQGAFGGCGVFNCTVVGTVALKR